MATYNINADFYHAGLTGDERSSKQEAWIENKIRTIVCTSAFGMGIDKPDVRTVVHFDMPDCLENYYQEAGRAGRDGKRAYAVLLYGEKDVRELEESVQLRYPSLETIRKVYHAISNYLQVTSGSGEGDYYDFDLTDFIKKFKLKSEVALYSLKALEQDGWLSFNEQIFLPSSVQFTTNKDHLYEFENIHPQSEPVIKALLRAYEGIFDHFTPISEVILSRLLKNSAEEVKKQMAELNRYGIIEYQPQKDNPQLLLLRDRIKTEDLFINMVAYNQRKEKFLIRTKEIIHFVKEEAQCRSRIIGSYFGDDAVRACGICDNCLRQSNYVKQRRI